MMENKELLQSTIFQASQQKSREIEQESKDLAGYDGYVEHYTIMVKRSREILVILREEYSKPQIMLKELKE